MKSSRLLPHLPTLLALLLSFSSTYSATEFEVTGFSDDPLNMKAQVHELRDMNADPCALLRVESNIPGEVYLTDIKVYQRDRVSEGIYEFYISHRERNITLYAAGIMPLRYRIPKPLEKGKVYILRVKAVGDLERRIEAAAEIKLIYAPGPDEKVYGGLDGDVNLIDFSSGMRTFKPSPGAHTIRLNSKGRIWEKRYELKSGDRIEDKVEFLTEKTEVWDIGQLGGLYIDSNPQGATVFLNQAEQGLTPLTLNEVQPGAYQIEVIKNLYLPASRIVEVKSLDYENVKLDLTPNFGRVKISSEPSGAMIWIDNQQRGMTPLDIPQFNAGRYALRLAQTLYYEETDSFSIEPGGEFVKAYKLRPQFGKVTITSDPSGANVMMDGEPWGKSPVARDKVLSGAHVVKLSLTNYFDEEMSIRLTDGQHLEPHYKLRPSVGWLTVRSNPSDAQVKNAETGKVIGRTPIEKQPMDRGTYRLMIEKDQFELFETAIGLTLGGEQTIEAELKRSVGHLKVSTDPQGAKVYLNGVYKATTPDVIRDLPTGSYDIRLEKDGYDIYKGKTTVRRNEVTQVSQILGTAGMMIWKQRRKQAQVFSFVAPSSGQFISRQYVRGVIYAASLAGCTVLAYLTSQDHSAAESDYHDAMAGYLAARDQPTIDRYRAEVESALSEIHDKENLFNYCLIAAGGIYTIQLIDAWLFGGGRRPVALVFNREIKLEPLVHLANGRLNLSVNIYQEKVK